MKSFCVFGNAGRRLAVEVDAVLENIPMPETTRVPFQPDFVEGLFNIRGKIVPLLKLAAFVGGEDRIPGPNSRAVVVERGNFRFAAAAESMAVVDVDPVTIQPHPEMPIHPAFDGKFSLENQHYDILQLERLGALMASAMRFPALQDA